MLTLPDDMLGRAPLGYGGPFYGVYPAIVTSLYNEKLPGWVEVKLPWCPDTTGESTPFTAWARLASPMAGGGRGQWFYPDVQDEVLVSFEAGDPRRPYIIGGLWNGQDASPETMDQDGKNEIKSITSRTGVKITLDDTDKKQRLVIVTPGGHTITLQDDGENSAPFIKLTDSNGNTTVMNEKGIECQDKNQNKLTFNEDGIKATDKNNNTVTMNSSGIKLVDLQSSEVTMSGGNVTVKNTAGQSVTVSTTSVAVKDVAGDNVTVGPAGITVKDASGMNSVEVAPQGVTVQATPAVSLALNPSGIKLQAGPSILSVGLQGISLMGPQISIQGMTQIQMMALQVQLACPQFVAAAAIAQFAGVLQASVVNAPTVVSGTYTPGGGNML